MKVFITIWNRHTWADALCKDFVKAGVEPILIDNDSTYEPCKEWLNKVPYTVERMPHNVGPWAFFITDLYKKYNEQYFMISDSDQDISQVPLDFPEYLTEGLKMHTMDHIWKCGLSQECEDLPDNPTMNIIRDYERGCFMRRTPYKKFFFAAMDLGIAVYDRNRRSENPTNTQENGHHWYSAVRADRPYTSKHLDWYLTPETLREEDHYYFTVKNAHYGWGHKWYDETYKKVNNNLPIKNDSMNFKKSITDG